MSTVLRPSSVLCHTLHVFIHHLADEHSSEPFICSPPYTTHALPTTHTARRRNASLSSSWFLETGLLRIHKISPLSPAMWSTLMSSPVSRVSTWLHVALCGTSSAPVPFTLTALMRMSSTRSAVRWLTPSDKPTRWQTVATSEQQGTSS